MKHVSFPQVPPVPHEIKQKVMDHVKHDFRPSYGLSRSKLIKIVVPLSLVVFFSVSMFSFVVLQKRHSQSISSLSSREVQILEQKLGEADQILADLETI